MKTKFTFAELQAEQLQLEAQMHGAGIERFNANNQRAIDSGNASDTAWFRRLSKLVIEPMAGAIQAYVDYYTGREGRHGRSLQYLKMIPPEQAAYVTTKVIFDSLNLQTVTILMTAEALGDKIQDQIRFTRLESAAPKYVQAIKEGLKRQRSQKYDHKVKVLVHAESKLAENENPNYVSDVHRWQSWPKKDVLQIGLLLIDIFQRNIEYNGGPVVVKETVNAGTKAARTFLRASAEIVNWVDEFRDAVSVLSPAFAPCVIPPRDWQTPTIGGFHTLEVASRLHLVKEKNRDHLRRLTKQQMPNVYRCINALQRTAFQVNDKVLEIAQAAAKAGTGIAMPQAEPYTIVPAPVPSEFSELRGQALKDALTPEQWAAFVAWKRDASDLYNAEVERRSKYLETVRVLGQAEQYRKYESVYFVYSCDFRGRYNCQSSLLSPQGGDLQKGLLTFAKAKPLGETGRFWLAVHGAGLWGNDKVPFMERALFIENMNEDILDYASNPMLFKGWASADKPWQFLSWCFEWAALNDWCDNGNRTADFMSKLAVPNDGSCSGIQHYSALLRDPVGGKAVNLLPSDRPQDIYREVADVVIKKLTAILDSEKSTRIDKKLAKLWLSIGVTRGLTKKAVMTLPYGSTQLTCRESVCDYISELIKKEAAKAKAEGRPVAPLPFEEEEATRYEAEKMMSSLVWKSIGDVVVAARTGMAFIKSVTKAVAKSNSPLEWTTPTGFIVRQAVYKQKEDLVWTHLMGKTKFIMSEPTDDIDPIGMMGGCAPNFIHSYDASHLTLAICAGLDAGIEDFWVIHDSFGSHAADTVVFRDCLLDSFYQMYKKYNWLQEFKEENETRLALELDVEVPEFLGLDISVVKDSPYCFG